MSERKKCSKKLIITAAVLLFLILAVVCVMYFIGFDNIKALYYGLKYDKDEITTMIEDGSKKLDEKVAEYDYITARTPTEDEMKAVESGEITDQQLAEMISAGLTLDEYRNNGYKADSGTATTEAAAAEGNTNSGNSPDGNGNNAAAPSQPATAPSQPATAPQTPAVDPNAALQAECDNKVSQIVAKMYILRSSFTSALSGLVSQAYADYTAGVPKTTIASTYMSQGYGLEAQCDASVNALMSELTAILNQYGRSTELVNTIYATYESEKQYTKAYYMSLYANN